MVHEGPPNRQPSCPKVLENASHGSLFLVRGGSWRRKDGPSVPQAVVSLPRVSVFWADLAYVKASNLWKSQPDFFAER